MTTTQVTLSERAQAVLCVIAKGAHSRNEIANRLGLVASSLNGPISSLKSHSLIESTEGVLTATPLAFPYVVDVKEHRPGTKLQQARTIFDKHIHKGRQAVLEKFQQECGLTLGGSVTYFQMLRHESGFAFEQTRMKPFAIA